jgi:ABC-type Fe3+/spermidine/putrescine transport system ATPase subunit
VQGDDGQAWVELDGQGRLALSAASPPAGTAVRVALRPEDVDLEPLADGATTAGLIGTVAELIYCGGHFEGAIRLGPHEVVLEIPREQRVERGQRVALRIDPAKVKTWPV